MKKQEHLFLVPANKEGIKFVQQLEKFIVKPFKVKTFKFGIEDEKHKVFIGCNLLSSFKKTIGGPQWLSLALIDYLNYYCNNLYKTTLINLIRELQKEFKTKSINESTAVKRLMERLLASYIAGKFKGKYE